VPIALGANQVLSSATHLFAKGAVMAIGALPVALIRFLLASSVLYAWQRSCSGYRQGGRGGFRKPPLTTQTRHSHVIAH
jgi:hypothetical protein